LSFIFIILASPVPDVSKTFAERRAEREKIVKKQIAEDERIRQELEQLEEQQSFSISRPSTMARKLLENNVMSAFNFMNVYDVEEPETKPVDNGIYQFVCIISLI
jgi:hypothetical protein